MRFFNRGWNKAYLAEIERQKTHYSTIIPKTRDGLEQLYDQCEQVSTPNFLKTGAVDFCKRVAEEQTEDEMYLPCMAYIYFICRTIKPKVVVETGVERGASTYTILSAFDKNKTNDAILYSFDLTPDIFKQMGVEIAPVIPRDFYEKMAKQHKHYYGYSKDTMPTTLAHINSVDFAFIGSDHGYENQSFETRQMWNKIRDGGICLVDRPDYNDNRAWNEFVMDFKPSWTVMLPEAKASEPFTFGVMIK